MHGESVIPAYAGISGEEAMRRPREIPAFAGLTIACLSAALLLAACGNRQSLKPAAGSAMPQKSASSPRQATVDDLLTRPPQSQPERVDDLLRKSQERREDRFDLPPAG